MERFITHMFWAYGDLSNLEKICISSFVSQNYSLNLWTYGGISNTPAGVIVRDAREILPEEMVFLNGRGSYASFSDLFRYAVLNKIGGLYADTDVIALQPESTLPENPFLVTEKLQIKKTIKNIVKIKLGLLDQCKIGRASCRERV